MSPALAPDAVQALPGVAGAAVAWRFQGRIRVTVIAKATFDFASDEPMRRRTPQEIVHAEVHYGNNPGRSLRLSSDLSPFLPHAEVMFTGHAYPPAGEAVRLLPVRLAIFDGQVPVIDKRLLVQHAEGFQRMPIVYEQAVRGPGGQDNPLGTSGVPSVVDPADPRRPAGFGPIARTWPVRRRLLGKTPPEALEGAVAEIPEAFDGSYFQAAPTDQRIGYLRGDEWILLEGLHPDAPLLRMRLPGARARARVHGLSAFGMDEGLPLELSADTLRIDGEEQTCTVTWRLAFPMANEAALAAVRFVVGVDVPGEEVASIEDPPTLAPAPAMEARSDEHAGQTVTLRLDNVPPQTVLPFRPADPATLKLVLDPESPERQKPVLPFVAPDPDLPSPAFVRREDPPDEHVSTGTLRFRIEDEPSRSGGSSLDGPQGSGGAPASPEPSAPAEPETGLRAVVVARVRARESLHDLPLAGVDLSGIDFSGASLVRLDLRGARLSRCTFVGARLVEARLAEADLTGAALGSADLTGADLSRALLAGARFDAATLSETNLSSAQGSGVSFEGASGRRASFAHGVWDRATFHGADLPAADFAGASLTGTRFQGASLFDLCLDDAHGRGARFDGARMPRAHAHGAALRESSFQEVDATGSSWQEATLEGSVFDGACLRGADLTRAACAGASFAGADAGAASMQYLRGDGADLRGADLEAADLRHAHLHDAIFDEANLRAASAMKADLSRCRFSRADLSRAILRGAKLKGAKLSHARLDGTSFLDADLEGANVHGASMAAAKTGGANLKGVVDVDPEDEEPSS
jgi:uncharacterized protein YjbI with pentapeptide repeats